jgi:hypothetical protein
MTNETDIVVDSSDRFTAVLEAALANAHRNDVDVEGGWLIESSSSDGPNWDIEIWQAKE